MNERPTRSLTLREAADLVGGDVSGDSDRIIHGIAPVDEASAEQLGFLAAKGYLGFAAESQAGALLVLRTLVDAVQERAPDASLLAVDDPHGALRTLLEHLIPQPERPAGVHPTAIVATDAHVAEGVWIGPYAIVESGAHIGAGTSLSAHVVVGRDCRVGEHCILHPHVVLYAGTELGDRVEAHSGVRLGVDGFGYVYADGAHKKVPQVGGCVIGDDVEIGANTCIDRGSIGCTRIGSGTKIDNLVHIAHNVVVGELALIVAQVGIAGSSKVGAGAMLGGQVGVSGHLEVGAGARLGAQAGVIGNVPEGATFWGTPARPRRETLKRLANMGKIEGLAARLKALEDAATASDGDS